MSVSELRDAWAVLGSLSGGDLRLRTLEGVAAAGLDVLGRRHILFQVAEDAQIAEDRASAGVQIVRHVLEDADGRRTYVDVTCTKSHLGPLFEAVAEDMILEVAEDPARPDLACHRVLAKWRELINKEATAAVGPEKLAGIFGELLHLREIVKLRSSSVENWVGPMGARHDFVSREASLEVKATLARHGRFYEIHSHDQLEPVPGAPLFLGCLKLERTPSGGQTVLDLLDEIVGLGADKMALQTLVARAGLPAADAGAGEVAFRVEEHRIYEVTETFPAIVARSFVGGAMPPGVMRLRYLIDLTAEPPYALPEGEHAAVFRKVAAGR